MYIKSVTLVTDSFKIVDCIKQAIFILETDKALNQFTIWNIASVVSEDYAEHFLVLGSAIFLQKCSQLSFIYIGW